MALRLSPDGRALHLTELTRQTGLETPAAHVEGLLRVEAETLGILRHDAGHAALDLEITRVIVTGIAGNICVLFTANDAYMRGLRIYAPADCIVSNTAEDNAHALRQIQTVLKGRIDPSDQFTFARRRG